MVLLTKKSRGSTGQNYTLPTHHYPPTTGRPNDGEADDDDDDEQDLLAELDAVENQLVDWRKGLDWRWWCRWRMAPYYLLAVIIGVVILLMTLYHKQILAWLRPAAEWMQALPAGWTIPIAVLVVISFPPLFGHEIVAVLVGIIWGLWIGFGIVAAGTFLGEMANFFTFKYWFRAHAERLEEKDVAYACLAQAVRDGGFWLALVARLSAIPGHFTTVVFSTCGMSWHVFALGAILSLPKQLITVYLGVALEATDASARDKAIQTSVLVITTLVTIGAAWWIWAKMKAARPAVVRGRRRRAKELRRRVGEGEGEEEERERLKGVGAAQGDGGARASVDSLGVPRQAERTPRPSTDSYAFAERRPQHPAGPNARAHAPPAPAAGYYSDPYRVQPTRSPRPPAPPAPRATDDDVGPSHHPQTHGHALEPSAASSASFHSAHTTAPLAPPLPPFLPPTTLESSNSAVAPSYRSTARSFEEALTVDDGRAKGDAGRR